MSLFKWQKSRQEKITDIEFEAPTDTTQNSESGDTLGTLGDMPITGHLIELRTHLIKICVVVLIIFLGRVEHWRQINGKKNSERLIFKFSHKKDIVRYASHHAQR